MKFLATARHVAATLSRATVMAGAVFGALATSPAQALDVYVRVGQFNQTMPDGTTVPMWGYRVTGPTDGGGAPGGPLASPGAAITVPAGDPTLNVYLFNRLAVPTSFVLHGQNAVMTPVFTNGAGVTGCTPGSTLDCRVRSFAHETPPGNVAPVVYTFTDVKPGTYLYQSGTLPQIQVQMGLYGMMRKNAAANTAYTNVPYQQEVSLLFSEVDPAFHNAVSAGTFAGSTLGYDPKFFRLHRYGTGALAAAVNVTATPTGPQPLEISPGQSLLLRTVNAGLQSRALAFDDGHWYVMAEDGNPYPYPREQYSVFLPAAKTADVWFTPTLWASSPLSRTTTIFDRRLALTNNNAQAVGGMLFQMRVQQDGDVPTLNVSNCPLTGTQGAPYTCTVTSNTDGVATYSLDIAPVGMSIDPASGVITWVPTNDQAQRPADPLLTNPLRVRAYDSANGGVASSAVRQIAIANVNDAPLAVNDVYTVRGGALAVGPLQSVKTNDSDPDGDNLGNATLIAAPVAAVPGEVIGFSFNPDGSFAFTTSNYAADRVATFTYQLVDSFGVASNVGTVSLAIKANVAPTARDDATAVVFNVVPQTILIDVLVNDNDIDNNLVPASLAIVGAPNAGGTATVVTAGCPVSTHCISYTPPVGYRGTDTLTYTVKDALGLESRPAYVRVNIQ